MNKNVLEWLEHTVGRLLDKVCYMQQGKELTFLQIRKKAMSVGTRLADLMQYSRRISDMENEQRRKFANGITGHLLI